MRILVSGYYGFGNTGDEALLSGLIQSFKSADSVRLTVLSANPKETHVLHHVAAIPRNDWRLIWRTVKDSDLFVSGGGGLLQDRTSFRSPYYYLGLIQTAISVGVPVYLFGQGVGPIDRRITRRVTTRVLSKTSGIGVRDAASRDLLMSWGVPETLAKVTSDAAFALERPSELTMTQSLTDSMPEVIGNEYSGSGPYIGVVWRSCVPFVSREQQSRLTLEVARALIGVTSEIGGTIVIIPFQPAVDTASAEELRASIMNVARSAPPVRVLDASTFEYYFALISAMDLLLTVRFHGLVMGIMSGIPAVSISYDPKVEHLAEEAGVRKFLPLEIEEKPVMDALLQAWELRDDISGRWRKFAEHQRTLVFQEGERAMEIVRESAR